MEQVQIVEPMFKTNNGVERFLTLCARSNAALTYDDVLLVPQFSDIESRKKVNLHTKLFYRDFELPIIAANMDSVTESAMAIALSKLGGFGVIHRYMDNQRQLEEISKVFEETSSGHIIAVAIGINTSFKHIENLIACGANTVVIDIAHGHYNKAGIRIHEIRETQFVANDSLPVEIIAGNVATAEGVRFLYNSGAHTIKIGVGPGKNCITRSVTGHGVPQLYAVAIAREFGFLNQQFGKPLFKLIADGGIRNSGDIVKALAVGADAVMLGNLLAGTDETPGPSFFANGSGQLSKAYRGMASREAQEAFYGNDVDAPEGIVTTIPYKGKVEDVIKILRGGLRSGLSYSGANNIQELYEKADWVRISSAGLQESLTK